MCRYEVTSLDPDSYVGSVRRGHIDVTVSTEDDKSGDHEHVSDARIEQLQIDQNRCRDITRRHRHK